MQISDILIPDFYTHTPFGYQRRQTKEINIGGVYMGGNHPIRVQSMTNVSTLNTEACVEQIIRLHQAGSELVRVSTPSIADAKNLIKIKKTLTSQYTPVPLIADIHFQPKVAEIAAQYAEKIRINPGNYIDRNKEKLAYTETEYQQIIEQIADNLYPLLQICKQNGTAIRIGTNHGSLSQRIVNRYGNTPLGMAMSAMEFVTICNNFGFNDLVLSMKASNTKVMIQSVRLLVAMLDEKKWNYPLHLGVTEAGNGEYGRVKSAVGIMPLLLDGIGDTIRVSLTEPPENEIPFAKILAETTFNKTACGTSIKPNYNPYTYSKRKTYITKKTPFIVSNYSQIEKEDMCVDDVKSFYTLQINNKIDQLNTAKGFIFQVDENDNLLHWRKHICQLNDSCDMRPIVWKFIYNEKNWMKFYAKVSGAIASLAIDGFIDGIWIENQHFIQQETYNLSLQILQASGLRFTTAEYIACPSCGRTQYNIEELLNEIKSQTFHLRNLKIGVMGCIVNGPGEMVDADYGVIGSGKRKVCLYKGQTQLLTNIDQDIAVEKLIELIKKYGDWIEK